jgi:hypothetical protein
MCDRPHLRENREGVLRSADESKAEREAKRELAREMLRIGRLGYIAQYRFGLTPSRRRMNEVTGGAPHAQACRRDTRVTLTGGMGGG